MNGKDNIIANILSKAEEEKAQALAAANAKAEAVFQKDEAFCADQKQKTLLQCEENEKLTVSRAVSAANMSVKKIVLQAKQEKISEVFSKAEKAVLSLSDEKYLQFILSLLDQCVEDGDTVVVSAADEKKVSKEKIASYAKQKGLTLSYRADGNFSGGVLLEGARYDKNLTLAVLLKEYRELHEAEVAAILAGE